MEQPGLPGTEARPGCSVRDGVFGKVDGSAAAERASRPLSESGWTGADAVPYVAHSLLPEAVLTDAMIQFVEHQRLGYVATVRPDGTPAVSPKATLSVLDREHLAFADLRSPGTTANLRVNPAVEVNVVDPLVRKGYRFAGTGEVLDAGPDFRRLVAWFGGRTVHDAARRARSVVVIRVGAVRPLVSPGYDREHDEAAVRARWTRYYLGDGSDAEVAEAPVAEPEEPTKRRGASSGLVIVATMTVRSEAAESFRSFEATAARVMRVYGGTTERIVRAPDTGAGTFREVHVVTFPDEAALAAYRADPSMAEASTLREASVVDTEILTGSDVEGYDVPSRFPTRMP